MKQPSDEHPLAVAPFAGSVKITSGDTVLAESGQAQALMEATYPIAFYVPRADVRMELFEPSQTRTHCPYKGDAVYFSLKDGGEEGRDVAWSYEQPSAAVATIAGHLAFYPDKVAVKTKPA